MWVMYVLVGMDGSSDASLYSDSSIFVSILSATVPQRDCRVLNWTYSCTSRYDTLLHSQMVTSNALGKMYGYLAASCINIRNKLWNLSNKCHSNSISGMDRFHLR